MSLSVLKFFFTCGSCLDMWIQCHAHSIVPFYWCLAICLIALLQLSFTMMHKIIAFYGENYVVLTDRFDDVFL